MNTFKIILASQSPRRQELLKSLNYKFETLHLNIDESYSPLLKENQITEYLAEQKSKRYGEVDDHTVVITADTIVWMNDHALEKPENFEQAKKMLFELSGNSHKVYTSVGFSTKNDFKVFTDCTEVHFLPMNEKEIEFYISHFKPYDKSGSYGIQDWIGLAKIDKIKGSFFTIMGLPTHIVYEYLENLTF
ncbi:septum formation protein Maf [Apibacter sp. B3889]|uniref:Maf family nucleotide pyrophosphatase n=1 Tax=Apibacter TaxID=1778601 RepID=UPI001323C8B4|nr:MULTISPECIES: Maf family nucleotide pyrophosphatase [Apibacter]MXO33723.1 septum formation protein Maf [Apibacter sp. B3883]MXO41080.1 septum formation protein Maf [Apibacter sp. B3889]MXP04249.1 septum formation protein Maf [Apibacter sp. B3887]MXP06940.1 septum formation protein Maf [Apibacter sp. B3935]